MANFIALFPTGSPGVAIGAFGRMAGLLADVLRADRVRVDEPAGAPLLVSASFGHRPELHVDPDGRGWIAVKGAMFDTTGVNPQVKLTRLLDEFLVGQTPHLNRFEGTFALAAWDARRRIGWVVNDQTSMLSVAYCPRREGVYVSTNALVLARGLGLSLDPDAVREFLVRGVVLSPRTMFAGMHRVGIGEHVVCENGRATARRHWSAYPSTIAPRRAEDASRAVASIVVDRVGRYRSVSGDIVCDLTGGLDSRLLAAAIQAGDLGRTGTVNGPRALDDVRVARRVAERLGWVLHHFVTPACWTVPLDASLRRELLYRTCGELSYPDIYHHSVTRPVLARSARVHMLGSGGELLRFFPWSQEFFGIGRRQLANIENVLDYRFLPGGEACLLTPEQRAVCRHQLRERIREICREQPDALTTQQLNAVYIWKMTSHSSLYISSTFDWLPSVAPLLTAGVVSAAVALAWPMCLTSNFQRRVIHDLSPTAASVSTVYGGSAERWALRRVHHVLHRTARSGAHFAAKLERVALGGLISRHLPSQEPPKGRVPFVTSDLRSLLAPTRMRSRALYSASRLASVLDGSPEAWHTRVPLVARVATVESLCVELEFEPDERFLTHPPVESGGPPVPVPEHAVGGLG